MKKIKKLTALLLAAALMFTSIPAAAAGTQQNTVQTRTFQVGETLMITVPGGVDVYAGPGITYDRLLTLGYGNQLIVTDTTYAAGWMKISCGGHSDGWVSTDKMAVSSETITSPHEYLYTGKQAKILAGVLNVYATPFASHTTSTGTGNLSGALYKGQVVDALGYTSNGWTKVKYNLNGTVITGYVSSAWVKISAKPANTPTETFKKIYGYSAQVNTEYEAVSVYASPRMDSSILTTLYSGQVVTILAQSQNWYKVTMNADDEMITGYVHSSFVTRKNALSNLYLNKTEKTLKIRGKYQLALRGTTGMNVKVTWKSSKNKVASVSKRGYVTAKKAGTAKITCTAKVGNRTKKLTCRIIVK